MKKLFTFLVLCCTLTINARTLYLNTGGSAFWETDDCKNFAIWSWKSGDGHWSPLMTNVKDNLWKTTIPDDDNQVIFVRLSSSTPDWKNIWNQTEDQVLTSDDLYTITGWGEGYEAKSVGSWSTYSDSHKEEGDDDDDDDDPEYTEKSFATATPANCEDVMFQAFYYDSNEANGYGDTKWATLISKSNEFLPYFDMIWLPPSAYSSGGTGYHPKQFCNQNGSFGSDVELRQIISLCHENNIHVIADIVLNHHDNRSSWCDFWPEDFGHFGAFQLTKQHICGDDEMWTAADAGTECTSGARGNNDTGELYAAARDLDHTNSYVQQFSVAYLKWLINEMDYDGFRWDVAKGFAPKYFGQYVAASKPYFSVGEYFDGNYDALKNWVDGTGKRSTTFDFAFKYNTVGQAFRDGTSPDLTKLIYNGQPAGFVGAEYRQYSVTFIDNHDTFERSDNQGSEFLGYKKSMKPSNKTNVLMANAFMLAMPGVPCVFYPHWFKYKTAIQDMIIARKTAGIHNMSAVSVSELAADKLIATITGNKGKLILKLGSGAGCDVVPSGYKKIASGTNYAMFVESKLTIFEPKLAPTIRISPESGSFTSKQMVSITCTGENATIYYTTDGTEPKAEDAYKYTTAFAAEKDMTVKAFAIVDGKQTATKTVTYEFIDTTQPITVSLYKPSNWTDVNIYAWTDTKPDLLGKWPGTKMTDPERDNWYSYTFDVAIHPVHVVFSTGAGAPQTQDIKNIWKSSCYCINAITGMGVYSPDCMPMAIDEVDAKTVIFDATLPMYNILGQPVDATYRGIIIQQGHKFLLQ